MEKGTISICFVDAVLQGVRERGIDPDSLLEQSGISPALLALPHARVSAPTYSALLRLITRTLDDEFFGQDSRRMKPGSFAMLCRSVVHCRTFETALARILDFFALLLDDLWGTLDRDGEVMHLTVHERQPDQPPRIFAQETLLVFARALACWLVNRRIPIAEASFRYGEPAHSGEYELLFCSNLRFGAAQTRLTFDAKYATLPVVRSEYALTEFLRVAPENMLVQYKDSHSLAARIRNHLHQVSPADWPSFEDLADQLGASVSTLRRRLETENQSYQVIKDHLRRDKAINLLSESGKSIMTIAEELGFAEPSAFHRAFKKWTGARPGEYRRTLGKAADTPPPKERHARPHAGQPQHL
jgi:AraC-like DNA-binding protein